MKKVFVLPVFLVATLQLHAQNVGIGTDIPKYPLTVIANANSAGIVQKAGNVELGFYANGAGAGSAPVNYQTV